MIEFAKPIPPSTLWTSSSPEETQSVGRTIAKKLSIGDTVILIGTLGAGKTTIAKAIIHALTGTPFDSITSPTYTYLHEYKGDFPLNHFDFYRADQRLPFTSDFKEYLYDSEALCLIEWPERIENILPKYPKKIYITHAGMNERNIRFETRYA